MYNNPCSEITLESRLKLGQEVVIGECLKDTDWYTDDVWTVVRIIPARSEFNQTEYQESIKSPKPDKEFNRRCLTPEGYNKNELVEVVTIHGRRLKATPSKFVSAPIDRLRENRIERILEK